MKKPTPEVMKLGIVALLVLLSIVFIYWNSTLKYAKSINSLGKIESDSTKANSNLVGDIGNKNVHDGTSRSVNPEESSTDSNSAKTPWYSNLDSEKLNCNSIRYDGELSFKIVTAKSANFEVGNLLTVAKLDPNKRYLRINVPEWDANKNYKQFDELLDNICLIDLKDNEGRLVRANRYVGNTTEGSNGNNWVLSEFNANDLEEGREYALVIRENSSEFRAQWAGVTPLKVVYKSSE